MAININGLISDENLADVADFAAANGVFFKHALNALLAEGVRSERARRQVKPSLWQKIKGGLWQK